MFFAKSLDVNGVDTKVGFPIILNYHGEVMPGSGALMPYDELGMSIDEFTAAIESGYPLVIKTNDGNDIYHVDLVRCEPIPEEDRDSIEEFMGVTLASLKGYYLFTVMGTYSVTFITGGIMLYIEY